MAKILLVEDDNLVRDMLVQVLQRASHEVESAANGEEATELLKTLQSGYYGNPPILLCRKKAASRLSQK